MVLPNRLKSDIEAKWCGQKQLHVIHGAANALVMAVLFTVLISPMRCLTRNAKDGADMSLRHGMILCLRPFSASSVQLTQTLQYAMSPAKGQSGGAKKSQSTINC